MILCVSIYTKFLNQRFARKNYSRNNKIGQTANNDAKL